MRPAVGPAHHRRRAVGAQPLVAGFRQQLKQASKGTPLVVARPILQ